MISSIDLDHMVEICNCVGVHLRTSTLLTSYFVGALFTKPPFVTIVISRVIDIPFASRSIFIEICGFLQQQLLELGERIGCVKTGLKEDEMKNNIRKIKLLISNDSSKHQIDKKCTICQVSLQNIKVSYLKNSSHHFIPFICYIV